MNADVIRLLKFMNPYESPATETAEAQRRSRFTSVARPPFRILGVAVGGVDDLDVTILRIRILADALLLAFTADLLGWNLLRLLSSLDWYCGVYFVWSKNNTR